MLLAYDRFLDFLLAETIFPTAATPTAPANAGTPPNAPMASAAPLTFVILPTAFPTLELAALPIIFDTPLFIRLPMAFVLGAAIFLAVL